MPDTMADRRVAVRVPLILAAELTEMPDGSPLHARTSDISRTGCYIDTLNPIPAGSLVRVKLTRSKDIFEGVATVMYVSAGLGMGLRFEELPPAQVSMLERWLAEATVRR